MNELTTKTLTVLEGLKSDRDQRRWEHGPEGYECRCHLCEGIREIERLERAMQQVMARLADLLSDDNFNNIEAVVRAAGVRYPDECSSEPRAALQSSESNS